jgi:hypothetical protein
MAVAPGFLAGVNQTYLWMYSEYMRDCALTVQETGYAFAFFNLFAGISAFCMRRVKCDRVGTCILFGLVLTLGASTIGLISVVGAWAWLLLLPQQVVRSVPGVLFSQTVNAALPDNVRVTALSVRNAIRVLLYVTAMLPWWLGVDVLGRSGMFSINLMVLGTGFVVLWVTRKWVTV